MNLSNEIQNWLDHDGFFVPGVQLLAMTGANVRNLQRHVGLSYIPDPVMTTLKRGLLQYIIKHPPTPVNPEEEPKSPPPDIRPGRQAEPEEVVRLRERAKPLHKRHDYLKAQLCMMSDVSELYTDEQRYEIAHEIMSDIIPQLDEIYDNIRKYENGEQLPGLITYSDVAKEVVEAMKKIEYNNQRTSRLRGWLKKKQLSKPDQEQYELEIAQKAKETAELKSKLGL